MGKQISLNVKCKKCGKSLMDYKKIINDKPSIGCDIKVNDQKGRIWLCSTYGCYDHQADIDIPTRTEVEFFCPHCLENLETTIRCNSCRSNMIKFDIEIGGVVSICSRAGCTNHYVMFEDLADAIRKYHQEYGI